MEYSFDTSGFLNPWKNHYRPTRFGRLWDDIDRLIQNRTIVATQMVYYEFMNPKYKEDEISRWIQDRKDVLFITVDLEQQFNVTKIEEDFPSLTPPHSITDKADPYVIALAMQLNLTVVTDERRPKKGRVKIPEVCDHYGVKCIDFQTFLDEIDYQG